jgi:hypothetical protein
MSIGALTSGNLPKAMEFIHYARIIMGDHWDTSNVIVAGIIYNYLDALNIFIFDSKS